MTEANNSENVIIFDDPVNIARIIAGLQEGRIVNYVMKNGDIRPMIVVNAWDRTDLVNGVLLFDGTNDNDNHPQPLVADHSGFKPTLAQWVTSAHFDAGAEFVVAGRSVYEFEPGTWHFPTRQPVIAAGVDANAIEQLIEMRVHVAVEEFAAARLYSKQAEFMDSVNASVGEKLAAQTEAVNKLLDAHSETVLAVCAPDCSPAAVVPEPDSPKRIHTTPFPLSQTAPPTGGFANCCGQVGPSPTLDDPNAERTEPTASEPGTPKTDEVGS